MKDWEMLRDEMAQAEETAISENPIMTQLLNIDKSSLRDFQSEDAFADYIEVGFDSYITDGVVTDETVEKYRDFFDRHGLPTDLKAVMAEKQAEFARKQALWDAQEFEHPLEEERDYKSDCRRIRKTIGRQLRDARISRGDSLTYASERTGIPEGLISRIEAGRANAEIDTISILAKTYNAVITIYG